MEAEELPKTTDRERRFSRDWFLLVILVIFTVYALMQIR
jgi:hypothetical protein